MSLGGALAAGLGAGFAADVLAVARDGGELIATRGGYGGKVQIEVEFPPGRAVVLCLRGGAFEPPQGEAIASLPATRIDDAGHLGASRHIAYREAPDAEFDIATSEFVLAIGRGVSDTASVPRFQSLAERLGMSLACSRPITDAGWLPKPHQVGQSGTVASACKLYLALGISGAVRHLAGMKHVETVIAVNTDPAAPIFGDAAFGVCMDLFAFAEALEKRIEADSEAEA